MKKLLYTYNKIVDKLEHLTKLPFRIFLRFLIVGGTGIFVNMGIFYLLNENFLLNYKIAAIIAIEASIIFNFIFNSLWTWKGRKVKSIKQLIKRFIKYHLVTALSASLNYTVLIVLVEFFLLNRYLSNLIGISLASSINFILNHKFTFSKVIEDSD